MSFLFSLALLPYSVGKQEEEEEEEECLFFFLVCGGLGLKLLMDRVKAKGLLLAQLLLLLSDVYLSATIIVSAVPVGIAAALCCAVLLCGQ